MDKKSLQKIIKSKLASFANLNEFIFHKPTLLLRIRKDTLHIINFDVLSGGFYCTVAIQPLYIPAETISLSFGNRLNRFKINLTETWGHGSQHDVEKDLIQVERLIEENVLQWFDKVGNPDGIITFIEKDLARDTNVIVGFPPVIRNMYLGFSYLYVNNIELAYSPLQKVVEIYRDDKREWVVRERGIVENLLFTMKNESNKINIVLDEFVLKTKESMNIKI